MEVFPMRRIHLFSLVLTAVMLLTSLALPVSAASYTSDPTHTASFGTRTLPLSQYDPSTGAAAFTKNGKLCTSKHNSGDSSSNCYKFSYSYQSGKKTYTGSASQCLGFAFYTQQELFGFFYQNSQKLNAEKFNVITTFDTKAASAKQEAYMKNLFASLLFGAHIRTKSGHSLIYMDANDTHVWTYEANVDHRCGVIIRKWTWKQMYAYLKERNISYIASPKIEYICEHLTYDDYGFCTVCKKEFPLAETALDPVLYRVTKDNVPLRMRPYSPDAVVKSLKKGAFVTVAAESVNAKGNKWLKTADGMWIYSGNVRKFTCPHSAKSVNYDDYGVCKLCRKEYGQTVLYPLTIKTLNVCMRAAKDNVPVRDQPYSPYKTVYSVNKGDVLNIVCSAKNAKGNLWYLLDDNRWIYSGNVK